MINFGINGNTPIKLQGRFQGQSYSRHLTVTHSKDTKEIEVQDYIKSLIERYISDPYQKITAVVVQVGNLSSFSVWVTHDVRELKDYLVRCLESGDN